MKPRISPSASRSLPRSASAEIAWSCPWPWCSCTETRLRPDASCDRRRGVRAGPAWMRRQRRGRREALRPARRLLAEAAVRQRARHRPGDRRLPDDHQPRLLPHRRPTRTRSRACGRRSRARARSRHGSARSSTSLSTGPGRLLGSGHPDVKGQLAAVPRPASRSDDGGRSWHERVEAAARPTSTRSCSGTTACTRSTPCSARSLISERRRARRSVERFTPPRADHRLRGRPGRRRPPAGGDRRPSWCARPTAAKRWRPIDTARRASGWPGRPPSALPRGAGTARSTRSRDGGEQLGARREGRRRALQVQGARPGAARPRAERRHDRRDAGRRAALEGDVPPVNRVLMGLLFFPRGGSAHVARNLAQALPGAGWEARILSGSLSLPGRPGDARALLRRARRAPGRLHRARSTRPTRCSPTRRCIPPTRTARARRTASSRSLDDDAAEHQVAAWARGAGSRGRGATPTSCTCTT